MTIFLAEVIETADLLYNNNQTDEFGNTLPLGSIKIRRVSRASGANVDIYYARPMTMNIGVPPLNGELVYVFAGPSAELVDAQRASGTWYYLPFPVNTNDDSVINQIPDATFKSRKPGQIERPVTPGNVIRQPVRPISPLQTLEGDLLLQNKSGAAIRLGSGQKRHRQYQERPTFHIAEIQQPHLAVTLEEPDTPKARPLPETPQNADGSNKVPGKKLQSQKYRIEKLDRIKVGIYGGISQKYPNLRLARSCTLSSKSIPRYKKPQLVFDSGRVVLNAKDDKIFVLGKEQAVIEGKKVKIVTRKHHVDFDDLCSRVEQLGRELHRLTTAQAFFATAFGPTGPATNASIVFRTYMGIVKWRLIPCIQLPSLSFNGRPSYDFGINTIESEGTDFGDVGTGGGGGGGLPPATGREPGEFVPITRELGLGGVGIEFTGTGGGGGTGTGGGGTGTGGGGPKGPADGVGGTNPTTQQQPTTTNNTQINSPKKVSPTQSATSGSNALVYTIVSNTVSLSTGTQTTASFTIALNNTATGSKGWYIIESNDSEFTPTEDNLIINDLLADNDCLRRNIENKFCRGRFKLLDATVRKVPKTVKVVD